MKRKGINILLLILSFTLVFTISSCKKKESKVHAFSVSDNTQVYIAKSNLQYNPSLNEWRFAPNAYDVIGENNSNASENYNGWIDLFGWGATGISGVMPYSIDTDNKIYGTGHNDIANTDYDFGVMINRLFNTNYRMFTHDEIHYLLMYRKNATELFGHGTVNGVRGLIVLPDDFKCPSGINFKSSVDAGFVNQYNWYYSIGDNENYLYNNYSIEEYNKLEEAGAIFLPAVGMRYGDECSHILNSGHYWTSSHYGDEFANCLCIFEKDLFIEGNFDRCYGFGIRLITNA